MHFANCPLLLINFNKIEFKYNDECDVREYVFKNINWKFVSFEKEVEYQVKLGLTIY
jgi:hypothetical protein